MPIVLDFPPRVNAYNKEIYLLDLSEVTCVCCGRALHKHQYVQRTVVWKTRLRTITLLRVRCATCDKTYTLLPSFLLPWQRFAAHIFEYFALLLLLGLPITHMAEQLTSWASSIVSIRTLRRWKKRLHPKLQSWLSEVREAASREAPWDQLLLDMHRSRGSIVQEAQLLLAYFFGIREVPVPFPGNILSRLQLALPPGKCM